MVMESKNLPKNSYDADTINGLYKMIDKILEEMKIPQEGVDVMEMDRRRGALLYVRGLLTVECELDAKARIREIDAQVRLKLQDVLSAIKNQVGLHYKLAFISDSMEKSVKHDAAYTAFQFLEDRIKKEMNMSLPYTENDLRAMRESKNCAVNKIQTLFRDELHGRDAHLKVNSIVNIIEAAQRW
ncbi:MAG: hypothetical protein HOG49_43240 [Candidatus Scalindua sp.]|jgi:hypothetical protein|nr:hypothetical protein [Candidatus Scalindua sp.]